MIGGVHDQAAVAIKWNQTGPLGTQALRDHRAQRATQVRRASPDRRGSDVWFQASNNFTGNQGTDITGGADLLTIQVPCGSYVINGKVAVVLNSNDGSILCEI